MLLPDQIYRRIPHAWLLMGLLLLIFGSTAGPDIRYVVAYLLLGIASIGRSVWLFQARQRVTRRAEVTVLTATQRMERDRIQANVRLADDEQ
ncbi:MAG: hypothetical protein HQ492_04945 [Woeseiaceae bacterium]|nr:hypothetical protein [Woeseiaceae bacterium]